MNHPVDITQAIDSYLSTRQDNCVLVAYSGGVDSAVLLHAMVAGARDHHVQVYACYVDHPSMRGGQKEVQTGGEGASSQNQDIHTRKRRALLASFCEGLAVPLVRAAIDPVFCASIARKRGEEAAYRFCRYELLHAVAVQVGADSIVLGHHAEDNLESLMMQMLQGNAFGITGIRPTRVLSYVQGYDSPVDTIHYMNVGDARSDSGNRNDDGDSKNNANVRSNIGDSAAGGHDAESDTTNRNNGTEHGTGHDAEKQHPDRAIICRRPLLECRKAAVFAYAEAEGIDYFEDATNADERIPRNYLRHRVLPQLCERFSQAVPALFQIAQDMQELRSYLIEAAPQWQYADGAVCYPWKDFAVLPRIAQLDLLQAGIRLLVQRGDNEERKVTEILPERVGNAQFNDFFAYLGQWKKNEEEMKDGRSQTKNPVRASFQLSHQRMLWVDAGRLWMSCNKAHDSLFLYIDISGESVFDLAQMIRQWDAGYTPAEKELLFDVASPILCIRRIRRADIPKKGAHRKQIDAAAQCLSGYCVEDQAGNKALFFKGALPIYTYTTYNKDNKILLYRVRLRY